jgi:hypothetical protein
VAQHVEPQQPIPQPASLHPPVPGPRVEQIPRPREPMTSAVPQSAPPGFPPAVPQSPAFPQPVPGFEPPVPQPYEQPRFAPGGAAAPAASPVPSKREDSSYGRKAPALFAAIAAGLGVIIAVVALVFVLADRGDDSDSDVPTLAGPAPSDVRMRDYGSSVQLSWSDPANGRASFIVTVGQPGQQLRPMGQVGPATTSFNLKGLNAELDYCFAIVAVYSTSQFSTSPQTCTSRPAGSSTPSTGKR